ncbi:S-adenosyl-L-methionine-dependent methyltransferase [Hypoxylon cercidicola]|nr:S-adenosyl-L-methionine-dependent methyltransferase [Hypoxylon cercidicola]
MDTALDQIKQLAATVGGIERQRLRASLYQLAYSLETPDDTLHRYGAMHLQTAAVKVGFDIGIFKRLVQCRGSSTSGELAQVTGAEASLLSRLLRYLATIGTIENDSVDQYAANHLTENLAQEVTEAGVSHYFSTVAPQYQTLPTFLKKTGYRNPTDEMHTVFQDAWNTSLHGFAWFSHHPENLDYFNKFMAFRRQPDVSWLTVYPVSQEAEGWDPNRPVYVNIGGGIGHQCAQFKEKYPNIPGRVILQDLPHSIAKALPTPGVENMVHDFFQPQPIKGAKFYFMRGVFHNHPPHKVRELLANTKEAMAPDSVLLIDEMILPETGSHVDPAAMDLTMMTAFAGMERTQAQWQSALSEVGLKLVETYVYNSLSHESVMDVRL